MDPRIRPERTPLLVLTASLLLTAAATAFTAWTAHERDAARFQNAAQSAHDRITSRLEVYINSLRGIAALFASSDTVTAEEFRTYAERLDLSGGYPGVQGVGWTQRSASGWPRSSFEQHSIRYLEPLNERNRAALGYDMSGEGTRRAAMDRARDTAEPSLSGKVTLVQEIFGPKQAGFLLYVPVYAGGRVPATVAERRRALRGFAYSPFRADDLFRGIFGSELEPRVAFEVYDGTGADTAALLHRSPHAPGHRPQFTARESMIVAGRLWTVIYASEPPFEETSSAELATGVLAAGAIVSGFSFWLALGLARARRAAEAANRAKSDFLATMSHELRTPLNAIGGYVDLLDLGVGGPVNAQQRDYLARVQRAQQHLLGLINNILNFARLEAGGVAFHREPIALASLVREVAGFVTPLVAEKQLTFGIQPGPDLTVIGDADKIRQILLNLLSNAIKFTNEGGRITVHWDAHGSMAQVHVADTGIGIPLPHQEQIFDPFVQVDPDLTRTRMGSGLGLAIARELARGLDGELSVQSEPARGSTFTLRLPLQDSEAPVPDTDRGAPTGAKA
ncbi:MAG: hypothetical protein FIB01_02895 [Gemmatimonadetes bacterium]|nr:hypothetical protein [Gemmatimonadota bacterium]